MTVLLIEDNADDEALALRAMRRCPVPLLVKVARDGDQALELLEKAVATPELIICDLKLPRKHGSEIVRAIRANSKTKKIPVIIFSSSDEESELRRCQEAGADSYFRKPVDYDEYLAVLIRIVEDSVNGVEAKHVAPSRVAQSNGIRGLRAKQLT